MQLFNQEFESKIITFFHKLGINLDLIQEEELLNLITHYLDNVKSGFFDCGYCETKTLKSQAIWEDLTDDISFLICESCYLAGIDLITLSMSELIG